MFGSQALEVAIGLSFIYLLLSLICSIITELSSRIVGYRSRTLKKALRHILEYGIHETDKNRIKGSLNDIEQLYSHALVNGLSMAGPIGRLLNRRQTDQQKLKKGRPSYIPSKNFALAFFDTVMAAGIGPEVKALDAAADALKAATPPNKTNADLVTKIKADYEVGKLVTLTDEQKEALDKGHEKLTDEDQKKLLLDFKEKFSHPYKLSDDEQKAVDAAIDLLQPGSDELKAYLENLKDQDIENRALQMRALDSFKKIEDGLDTMTDSPLKDALQSILGTAKIEAENWDEALAKARTGLETWFDEYMNRVNGWYKRNTQTIILIIAFIIAAVGNVDTLVIGRTLWVDSTLRQAVASQATSFVVQSEEAQSSAAGDTEAAAQEEPTVADLQNELQRLSLPIGWYASNDNEENFRDNLVIELPVGKNATEAEKAAAKERLDELAADGRTLNSIRYRWPMKIVGILLTALAVSLGAPFWFDLLGKLVNMRSTGKPEEENKTNQPEVTLNLSQ